MVRPGRADDDVAALHGKSLELADEHGLLGCASHTSRVSFLMLRWPWVRSPGMRIWTFIQMGKRVASMPVTERMPVMPLGPTVTISPERMRPW